MNPVAHARMAEIHLDEKRFEESLEEYGKALGSDPENPDYLRGAALVLYLTDDFPRAKKAIRRSLQIRESEEGLELLAVILEDQDACWCPGRQLRPRPADRAFESTA